MSIENPTLVHFRHFSSLLTNENRESSIQYRLSAIASAKAGVSRAQKNLFMQNKPNLPNAQMNVSSVLTKDYVNIRLRRRFKNKANQTQFKANSKPIKPKQTQFKPKQTQFQTHPLLAIKRFKKAVKYSA